MGEWISTGVASNTTFGGTAWTTAAPVYVASGASLNVYHAPPPEPEPTLLDWLAAEIDSICELAR